MTDMGIPPKKSSSQATVVVRVVRNEQTPKFSNLPEEITVNQTLPEDIMVFKVVGADEDENVPFNRLSYSIVGDDSSPAFFQIDSVTGNVTVRRELEEGSGYDTTYKVTFVMLDYRNGHCLHFENTAIWAML